MGVVGTVGFALWFYGIQRSDIAFLHTSGVKQHYLKQNYQNIFAQKVSQATSGYTLLIGDSYIQSFHYQTDNSLNYGIGGDTLAEIADRLHHIALNNVGQVILMGGMNDIRKGIDDATTERAIDDIQRTLGNTPLIWLTLPLGVHSKASLADIEAMNNKIDAHCMALKYCTIVNISALLEQCPCFLADGFHLNALAYQRLSTHLNSLTQ